MLFDGYLICSDWDSTLFYNNEICKENIEAIKYFQSNGGLFTVSSGRTAEFIKRYEDYVRPNTYSICLNGAHIINLANNDTLYRGTLDSYVVNVIDELLIKNACFTHMMAYFADDDGSFIHIPISEYSKVRETLATKQLYKVLLYSEKDGDAVHQACLGLADFDMRDYVALRSWSVGLEILKVQNAKGAAVKRVKEATGSKHLITVGDYENDIPMLKAGDIGYAVGNAIESLKQVADKITVPACDGAIAHIVQDIQNKIINSANE